MAMIPSKHRQAFKQSELTRTPGDIPLVEDYQSARRASRQDPGLSPIWELLDAVKDPEIPVLSIEDLGILQNIGWQDSVLVVTITPTYSGCPAMHAITEDIKDVLHRGGYSRLRVESRLAPAWTTNWLSQSGRQKLAAYGIAPPQSSLEKDGRSSQRALCEELAVACPRCHSLDTRQIAEFGSTACKALYQCNSCQEPFDYFKCH